MKINILITPNKLKANKNVILNGQVINLIK